MHNLGPYQIIHLLSRLEVKNILASFWFARLMILGRFECQFHPCAHASYLSSVGPPNSKIRKGPDNRRGEDATFDVLSSHAEAILRANRKLPIVQGFSIMVNPFFNSSMEHVKLAAKQSLHFRLNITTCLKLTLWRAKSTWIPGYFYVQDETECYMKTI